MHAVIINSFSVKLKNQGRKKNYHAGSTLFILEGQKEEEPAGEREKRKNVKMEDCKI